MRFSSLGSGSKGNATIIEAGETRLMIDCGFSAKETERRMSLLGLEPAQLDAVLVTHEHTDHSSGVDVLARKFGIPVYMTHGTFSAGRCGQVDDLNTFNCGMQFTIGDINVDAMAVPHDAREPCQYTLESSTKKLGVLTDLGSITPFVVDSYRRCDAMVLEFNHDSQMLAEGAYPETLKRRVGSDWGHLNNDQSAEFLSRVEVENFQHLVVAHVSAENNCPTIAMAALAGVADLGSRAYIANQERGFGWLEIN